ncbi:MAG: WD40 repeat domain-containing protein, partial [Chitinophagales bacterium]
MIAKRELITTLFCLVALVIAVPNSSLAQAFDDYKAFSSGKGDITAVRFSANGQYFVSGNSKGAILVRDAVSNKITHVLRGHTGQINQITIDPSNRFVAAASNNGIVKIWRLSDQEVFFTSPLPLTDPRSGSSYSFVHFSKDGKMLYFGGSIKTLFGVKVQEGGVLEKVSKLSGATTCSAYNQSRNVLALGIDGAVHFIDLKSGQISETSNICGGKIVDVAFNSNGTQVGTLCKDGTMKLVDMTSKSVVTTQKVTSSGASTEIAFSKDGKYMVTGDTKNIPKVWDLATMQMTCELKGHQAAVRSVDFSPDGKFILTSSNDPMIKMWKFRKIYENDPIPEPPVEEEEEVVVEKKPETPPTPPVTPELPAKETIAKNDTPQPDVPKINTMDGRPITQVKPANWGRYKAPKKEEPKPVVEASKPKSVPVIKPPESDIKLTFNEQGKPEQIGDREVKISRQVTLASDQVEITLWDDQYMDGDTVSVLYNGKWIAQNYVLRTGKRSFILDVNPNKDNYMVLYAHNLGERPPNTAAMGVSDGVGKYRTLNLKSTL